MWQNACVQGKRAKDTEFGAQEAFLHTVSRCPHGCVRTRRQEEVGFQDSTAGAKKKGRNGDGVWGEGEGGCPSKIMLSSYKMWERKQTWSGVRRAQEYPWCPVRGRGASLCGTLAGQWQRLYARPPPRYPTGEILQPDCDGGGKNTGRVFRDDNRKNSQ